MPNHRRFALRLLSAAFALVALACAGPTLAKGAHKPKASAKAPVDANETAWLHVRMEKAPPGWVASTYERLAIEQCLPTEVSSDPARLQSYRDNPYFHFMLDCSNLAFKDERSFGEWRFVDPQDARWPTQAVQIVFAQGVSDYRVEVTVYCDDASDKCQKLLDDTRAMRAPSPYVVGMEPGDPRMIPLRKKWESLVANEPCTPGPAHMEQPQYPRPALAEGEMGTVTLLLTVNRCGEVRDALVQKSSHFPILDHTAIEVARRWRVDVSTMDQTKPRPWLARVPVEFNL